MAAHSLTLVNNSTIRQRRATGHDLGVEVDREFVSGAPVSTLPKLLTLKMASEALGKDEKGRPLVSISVLRAEIRAKRLACLRPTPGSSARILISELELQKWVHEVAAKRQLAVSPSEARQSRAAASGLISKGTKKNKERISMSSNR